MQILHHPLSTGRFGTHREASAGEDACNIMNSQWAWNKLDREAVESDYATEVSEWLKEISIANGLSARHCLRSR